MRKKAGLRQKGGKVYKSLSEVVYNSGGFAIDEYGVIIDDFLTLSGISKDNIYLLQGILYDKQMLERWVTTNLDISKKPLVPHTGLQMNDEEIRLIKEGIPKIQQIPFYITVSLINNIHINIEHALKAGHLFLVYDTENNINGLEEVRRHSSVLRYLESDTPANNIVLGLWLKKNPTELRQGEDNISKYYPASSILKYQNPANQEGGKKKRIMKKK